MFTENLATLLETATTAFHFSPVFATKKLTMRQFLLGMLAGAALAVTSVYLAPTLVDKLAQDHAGRTGMAQTAAGTLPRLARPAEIPRWDAHLLMLGRLTAEMDREMAAMAQALLAPSPEPHRAIWRDLELGADALVSRAHGSCQHVVEIRHLAGHGKPEIISQTSGDCVSSPAHPSSAPRNGAPANRAGIIPISHQAP